MSRALRNDSTVSESTRLKVANAAELLNYRVDVNARNLRAQCTRTIALLLRDDSDTSARPINPFFLDLIGHITMAAARRGYDIILSFQQFSNDWRADYTERGRADGIIFLGYGDFLSYAQRIRRLDEAGAPYITWGPALAGSGGHFVGCDNEQGGYLAAAHLLALGRRRLAFLGDPTPNCPEFRARWRGYCAAHRAAGVPLVPELWKNAQSCETEGREAMAALIAEGEAFDGVCTASDLIAIGAIRALRDAGRRVPEDCAVVGFDDIYAAPLIDPPLTTVRQDAADAAERLVESLLLLIDGGEVTSAQVAPKLIVRGSCGAAAA